VLAIGGATVVRHARELVPGQLEEWIGLVVAKQNVVTRRQRLDEVVLKQQRFRLRPHHRGLDAGDLATIIAMRGDNCVLLK
jgi:hypothetical protein